MDLTPHPYPQGGGEGTARTSNIYDVECSEWRASGRAHAVLCLCQRIFYPQPLKHKVMLYRKAAFQSSATKLRLDRFALTCSRSKSPSGVHALNLVFTTTTPYYTRLRAMTSSCLCALALMSVWCLQQCLRVLPHPDFRHVLLNI